MTWNDINIKKFNELKEVFLDPDFAEEDRLLYEIQIIFDIDPFRLNINELHKYIKELNFASKKIPNMKVKDTYILGGTKYILKKKLSDFSVAQWIDFQHFLQDGGADSDNYPNLLSVFFWPEGVKEYNEGYDIEKVRKDIEDYLSIADAMSISSFFLTYHKALLIRSLSFTRKMTMKTPLPRKERRKVRKEYRKAVTKILVGG